jgi:hypothetical protein
MLYRAVCNVRTCSERYGIGDYRYNGSCLHAEVRAYGPRQVRRIEHGREGWNNNRGLWGFSDRWIYPPPVAKTEGGSNIDD